MSEKQTINDLLMEVVKLRKDNDYLSGELGYWKQQAQRNESVSGECDTESGVTLRDLFGIWKDTSDQLEADSREKLEADIWTVAYEIYRAGGWVDNGSEPNPPTDGIWKLLDRQAAITKREREQHWLEIVGASANCNLELTNKIAELQEKVDELEEENAELNSRHCPHYHVKEHYCDVHETRIAKLLEQVDELKDKYAKLLSEKVESDETCDIFAEKWEAEKKRCAELKSENAELQERVDNLCASEEIGKLRELLGGDAE